MITTFNRRKKLPTGSAQVFPQPATELFASLRGLPRPVWILFGGTFLNKFGSFVIPFLTLYMTRQGYTLSEAGMAISAYGVGHFTASGLGGYLADRLGRRQTIVISMFSAAIAMMLLSQARSLAAIIALTGLVGMTAELYRPASNALLADLLPPGQRVTGFSAYRLAFNAGWAFGPATAGFLAEHSFFWLFLGDAVTSALFGIVAWLALPPGRRSAKMRKSEWRAAFQQFNRDRPFLLLLAASFCIALVFMQMSSTFGVHVTGQGYSPETYGALISMNGLLVVLFELPLTLWTKRFPPRRMMALGYALIGVGFAINGIAHDLTAFLISVVLFTAGEMVAMPVASAHVAELAPVDLRGRYAGMIGLTWALALTLGPNVGLTLLQQNPAWLWLGCGAMGLAAAAIISLPCRRPASHIPI